jgi:DHA1 family bicyclomycin/chloramphenicol resistance-like MFS transporter
MSPATVVLALGLLLGLQPVTTDLYLPALPLLAADLQAAMPAAQLTMSALLLAFGLGQLLMGPLSDRFGRRPVLLGGLSLHALGGLGAALAPDIGLLIAMRAVQGLGLAASVVCGRAMVRDLYEPHEGAPVMSKGLSGLGMIACASPILGGVLATHLGWRASMAAVGLCGAATAAFIAWRLPETVRALNPRATAPGPLLRQLAVVARHPTFQAWSLLVAATYAGLYVLLAGSSFVYIGSLGLPPWGYGLVLASGSLAYIGGTVQCRRVLGRLGLPGAVRFGAGFSLAGGSLMLLLGLLDVRQWWPVLFAQWLFLFGHGFHQPCGQVGAVGPFPQAAGTASALAGFVLALTAFGVGLWMGRAMDGTLRMLGLGLFSASVLTASIAWTLVQRHGAARSVAVAG